MKSTKKRANRARKDLTFVPGNEIMDLQNEKRFSFINNPKQRKYYV